MGVTFVGKSPADSTTSSTTSWVVPELKQALVAALAAAKAQASSHDALEDAKFDLNGSVLEVQTGLSKTMLPLVLNAEAERIIKTALSERTGGEIQLKVLPDSRRRPEPAVTAVSSFESSFKQLKKAAVNVNAVSDRLSKQIELLDGAFKKLSLGVSAWVPISESFDDEGTRYFEDIGYTRVSSRWGIALRARVVHQNDPDDDETVWLFADAPRQLRIESVDKIPALMEKLCIQAEAMLAQLSKKVGDISALTETIIEGGAR